MSILQIGKYMCKKVNISSKNACFLTLDNKYFLKKFTNEYLFDREIFFINKCEQVEEIIKYHNIVNDRNCKFIVYPNLKCDDLFFHIMNNQLNKKTKNQIFYNIMVGINKIYQKNLIHGDIKMENILVQKDNNIKIIDFEFSQLLTKDSIPNNYGTRSYLSPEKMKGDIVSKKSDIWALGILYYMLINYQEPYEREFINSEFYYPSQDKIVDDFVIFSKEEKKLFNMMIQNNYIIRKNPDEIIKYMENNLL